MTFKDIGKRIGKDQTTISKEVKRHIHLRDDGIKSLDSYGNDVTREMCPALLRAPFVCNPCRKRHTRCGFCKQHYHAKEAQREYEHTLSDSREGIPLNKKSFYEMDRVITDNMQKGQRLYHIMQTHEFGVSKSTVYRHLKKGYLTVSSIDFPRVVKFKTRKAKNEPSVPKAAKDGRSYNDFLAYTADNGISAWTEMDTVIGNRGGKVILTLDFTFCNFMAGLLLDNKTAIAAANKISELKQALAKQGFVFGDIFPVLLTDNGGEFALVSDFEGNDTGTRETRLFFCDPMRSSQKPHVEKNHTLFRDIVPKGKSFDGFTQKTVNLIFSHVNGIKRKSLAGKSPYEVFSFTYSADIAKILGIEYVPPEQVIQSPRLLKK
jgi:IS30 family transposase